MGKKNKGSIPCDACNHTFASVANLQQHSRDKHRNPPTKTPPVKVQTPAEKPQAHPQNKPVPTSSDVREETLKCEHCLAHFTSSDKLEQHKIALHSWKCTKCPSLPSFGDGAAWQIHFNKVHAASARSGEINDTKGKEVKTNSNEGKASEQQRDVNHNNNTKTQKVATQPEPPLSGPPNVKNLHIGNPPLVLTPSDNQNEVPSSVSDKAESQPVHHPTPKVEDQTTSSDGRDPLSPKRPTLGLLVEIDPEPSRDQDDTIYEIASDIWSPTMTVSSIEADRAEEEDDIDMFPSRSLRPLNGSSPQKGQNIIVPPRVPKIGGRKNRTLFVERRDSRSIALNTPLTPRSGAIVDGNHLRDEPNAQTQDGLDGATPPLTTLEQYEVSRSESPTSTSFSSRDEGRDIKEGDLPHDPLPTRRSKPGSSVHFECRICLLDPTPTSGLAATHCGHLFCYECIATEVLRTSRCPVCKNVLALYCLFKLDVAS